MAHPFHIGRTLGDAGKLLLRHWPALLIAFVLLRMLPRVIIGEDMDAGLFGNDQSFMVELLAPLGATYGDFVSRRIMDVPDYLFGGVATVILLRDGVRSRWHGLLQSMAIVMLIMLVTFAFEAQPHIMRLTSFAQIGLILFIIPAALIVSLANAAAADERQWPPSAFVRSFKLVLKGPFRLLVLMLVVGFLAWLSETAEELMLAAIPVTDANWFDWVTTVFQECLSGFHLPFEAAIPVAAFLHLRRRLDGEKPEDTAAIFD